MTAPTLRVWSDDDPALGPTAAHATARHVAGPYRFEVLTGLSHWIPEQAPDRLPPCARAPALSREKQPPTRPWPRCSASVRAVRLASLNLLNGTSLDDGLVSPHRLAEAVQSLRADVLGLQEVDRSQPRSHGADLTAQAAEAMGAEHWRFVPALVGTPGGQWRAATDSDDGGTEPAYGVGLVSRWPVGSWHVTRLGAAPVRSPVVLPGTRRVVWLRDEPRVGLAAVVETPYGAVTVATAHLSFVPVWNGVQLRRLTADLGRLPGPRVLLGDLNMPRPLPAALTRWQPLARTPTYPSWEPRLQLDHVLACGDLPPVTAVEAPRLAVSDHRALLVELTRPLTA